jgi:hypothetical protein
MADTPPTPLSDRQRAVARALAAMGLVTFFFSVHAVRRFDRYCRELQCLGIIWFLAGTAAAAVGLAAGLLLVPRLAAKRLLRAPAARLWILSLSGAGIGLAWFVLLAAWDDW